MTVPSFHSPRVGGHVHLGKLDATPLRPEAVRYAELRRAIVKAGISLPVVPKAWTDFTEDFTDWGMKGNGPQDDNAYPASWAAAQGGGDCTCAGPGNEIQEAHKNAGQPVPKIGTKTCISQYSVLTKAANGQAYNPQTGSGDTGLNVQQVNEYRQKIGFADDTGKRHKIGTVIALDPGNLQHYIEMVYLVDTVGLGVQVQTQQMDQFNAGKPWDWIKGGTVEGGHYIPGMYLGRFVTWTKSTPFTTNWYENAVEEAYGHADLESYNALTGENATGFKDQDVERFIVLLAQKKAAALGL